MPNASDINRRFTYHPPTDITRPKHEEVNATMLTLAHKLDNLLPEGREKALALTKLEELRMWSNAAIATHVPRDPITNEPLGQKREPGPAIISSGHG